MSLDRKRLLDKCGRLAVGQHLNRRSRRELYSQLSFLPLNQNEGPPLPPLEPNPREASVNRHKNSRKIQKYRMGKKSGLSQLKLSRFTCYSRCRLSSDCDHASYLLLECLQLEKGGTRWPSTDVIWQPAGYLLEIQKTIISF